MHILLGQVLRKSPVRISKRRRDCAARDPHRVRDLTLSQPRDIPQHDGRPLPRRQRRDNHPNLHQLRRQSTRSIHLSEQRPFTTATTMVTPQHMQRDPIGPSRRRLHRPHPRPALQRPRTRLVHHLTPEVHITRNEHQRRYKARMHLPIPVLEIDDTVHYRIKSPHPTKCRVTARQTSRSTCTSSATNTSTAKSATTRTRGRHKNHLHTARAEPGPEPRATYDVGASN